MSETLPPASRLRIAFLAYRGNQFCGGQGVYAYQLTRALSTLGHEVTVFAGQPYPRVAAGVDLVRLPSLDLYREGDPFRFPRARELVSPIDLVELATMCVGGFPEPRTFSWRAHAALRRRLGDFDVVHDNQSLGSGLLAIAADGWPLVASIHHPVTIDRTLELEHAESRRKELSLRRWYGFARMQHRVARQIGQLLTVSESSRRDIVSEMGVEPESVRVVPVGVDPSVFRPVPDVARVPGRLMTTASADVALKGLVFLLEALAKIRTERADAHLVVIGRLRVESPAQATIERFGLGDAVEFVSGCSDEEIVRRYASAQVAVVPSLYEGFSLPAIEAMACGLPLVATRGGALPEVVGDRQETAITVAPGDAGALASAVLALLAAPRRAQAIAQAGRARVLDRFSWKSTALGTLASYQAAIATAHRC